MSFDPDRTQVFSRAIQLSPLATPHSIESLSRNPKQSRASLATPELLAAFNRPIVQGAYVPTVLSAWFILSLHVARAGQSALTTMHVLALRPDGTPTLTTDVKLIDLTKHLVKTKNSLYQLPPERKGKGEPSSAQLGQAWKNLVRWGYADAFGIPPVKG